MLLLPLRWVYYVLRMAFVIGCNLIGMPAYMTWQILLLPLKLINPALYWTIETLMFELLEGFVAIWLYSGGYKIVESGDDIRKLYNEKAVIILNHQSTADVPVIMTATSSMPSVSGSLMWIMDTMFKYTNFGLCSQFHGDFFIAQGKDNREEQIINLKKHLKSLFASSYKRWIVLFPEGGFLRKRKLGSKKFAKKNNLPDLEFVTIPRVGAFEAVLQTLYHANNQNGKLPDSKSSYSIKWVIDITIAYPGGTPLDLPGISFGYWPSCDILNHYRIYPVSEIPTETEKLTDWLYNRFIEKEDLLKQYYKENKFLDETDLEKRVLPRMPRRRMQQNMKKLTIVLIFYSVSTYFFSFYFYVPVFHAITNCFVNCFSILSWYIL